MMRELYDLIVSVYQEMNRTFDIPPEDITPATPLKDLQIDSLTFIMIMLRIEQEYGINMASDEGGTFETVEDVLDRIRKALSKR